MSPYSQSDTDIITCMKFLQISQVEWNCKIKYPQKFSLPIKGVVNTSRTLEKHGVKNAAKIIQSKITKLRCSENNMVYSTWAMQTHKARQSHLCLCAYLSFCKRHTLSMSICATEATPSTFRTHSGLTDKPTHISNTRPLSATEILGENMFTTT